MITDNGYANKQRKRPQWPITDALSPGAGWTGSDERDYRFDGMKLISEFRLWRGWIVRGIWRRQIHGLFDATLSAMTSTDPHLPQANFNQIWNRPDFHSKIAQHSERWFNRNVDKSSKLSVFVWLTSNFLAMNKLPNRKFFSENSIVFLSKKPPIRNF